MAKRESLTVKQNRAKHINVAAVAYTDMCIFAAVIELLEGGLVSADVQPDDFKIIEIAKRAQQKCLRRYDAAIEAANR